MTFRGYIRNGQITVDDPSQLPDGAEVTIEVLPAADGKPTVWQELLKLAGTVEGLPPDLAQEHDRYLYGPPPTE